MEVKHVVRAFVDGASDAFGVQRRIEEREFIVLAVVVGTDQHGTNIPRIVDHALDLKAQRKQR